MQLANCPHCGTAIQLEDLISNQMRLAVASGALLGASAVMGALLELPEYEASREGFEERLKEITEKIHQTVDHLTEWGEAYDED